MRVRAAVLLLCSSVVLAGCSSEPEPRSLPPAPSASPSPAALPLPTEAAAATPQGAVAFARYWLELVNRGFDSADASEVRAVSDAGCGGCSELIGAMEEEPEPGERIQGGSFQVLSAESPPLEVDEVIVELQYQVSEVQVLDETGKVVRTTPATPPTVGQMRLKRRAPGWVVLGFRGLT